MLDHTLSRWSQTPVLNIWYQQLLAQAYEIINPQHNHRNFSAKKMDPHSVLQDIKGNSILSNKL
jgi:hypothetical protein